MAGIQGSEGKLEQAAGWPRPCCASWLWGLLVRHTKTFFSLFLEYSEEYAAPFTTHQHQLRDAKALSVLLTPYSQHTKHQAKVNRLRHLVSIRQVGARSGGQRLGGEGTSLAWQLEVAQSDLSQPPHLLRAEQGPGSPGFRAFYSCLLWAP